MLQAIVEAEVSSDADLTAMDEVGDAVYCVLIAMWFLCVEQGADGKVDYEATWRSVAEHLWIPTEMTDLESGRRPEHQAARVRSVMGLCNKVRQEAGKMDAIRAWKHKTVTEEAQMDKIFAADEKQLAENRCHKTLEGRQKADREQQK